MIYDYIIVGAGSAGCVLADRLSASGRHSVLLIEAGGKDGSPLVAMPKGFGKLLQDPASIWHYPTEAEDGTPAEHWVRGKMLGGSSSVNGMMYFRGHPEDYEEWSRLGATGWGWSDMAPAFRAIEDHELGGDEGRGTGGPLRISVSPDRRELADRVIAAAVAIGVPHVRDLNHEDQVGIGYAPRTIYRGRRQSASRAFLKPALKRPNLHVETDVRVERVILDGRRACGIVGVGSGGAPVERRAAREIILCAGGLASPQILERSGIGGGARLRALGIEVIMDSPRIGENLLEHRLLMMHYALSRPISANPELGGWRMAVSAMRYLLGKGVLAAGSYDVGAFMKTDARLDRPDVELLMAPYGVAFDAQGQPVVPKGHSFHMFGYPLRSRSKGSVHIASATLDVPATIRPNYLSDPYDRETTIAMFRLMRRLVQQTPIAEVIERELAPGPGVESDAEIIAAFRAQGHSGYHACGTVAMGGADAPLDPQLRVRGVDGLRVVDGSVLPTMVSANTNGPIMAIGWRAAQLIVAGENH